MPESRHAYYPFTQDGEPQTGWIRGLIRWYSGVKTEDADGEGDVPKRWMNTSEVAALWSSVMPIFASPVSEQTVRRMCKSGELERRGIDYHAGGRQWYINRSSLISYLWIATQNSSRSLEAACGISQERSYEIIGHVGELHEQGGKEMDDYWRALMVNEFERCTEDDDE